MTSPFADHLEQIRAALVDQRRQAADPDNASLSLDRTLDEIGRIQQRIEVIDRALLDEALLRDADFKSRRLTSMTRPFAT